MGQAAKRGTSKSFGTIARGSLNLAAFQMVADLASSIRKGSHAVESDAASQVLSNTCCACCLPLTESWIKFVDKRALIQVALHGTDWPNSSRLNYALMYRSRHLTGFASMMSHRLVSIAKLFGIAVSGTATFAACTTLRTSTTLRGPL